MTRNYVCTFVKTRCGRCARRKDPTLNGHYEDEKCYREVSHVACGPCVGPLCSQYSHPLHVVPSPSLLSVDESIERALYMAQRHINNARQFNNTTPAVGVEEARQSNLDREGQLT